MEKKNVIFLSVIAVATLLTAVIGTTFAYFTATVNTNGTGTVNVKTQTIAKAVMDFGDAISVTEGLPGYDAIKPMSISADNGDTKVTGTITVTPKIPEAFGSDVTWALYESPTNLDAKCTNTLHDSTTDGKYYYSGDCANLPAKAVIGSNETIATSATTTYDVTLNPNETKYYYLVVRYENKENATQNTQQGETYSVSMSFAAKA